MANAARYRRRRPISGYGFAFPANSHNSILEIMRRRAGLGTHEGRTDGRTGVGGGEQKIILYSFGGYRRHRTLGFPGEKHTRNVLVRTVVGRYRSRRNLLTYEGGRGGGRGQDFVAYTSALRYVMCSKSIGY